MYNIHRRICNIKSVYFIYIYLYLYIYKELFNRVIKELQKLLYVKKKDV